MTSGPGSNLIISSYLVIFIHRSEKCFIMKVNVMALFYRNGSTEKGGEYLRSMSSFGTDLGTGPGLGLIFSPSIQLKQTPTSSRLGLEFLVVFQRLIIVV